MQLERRMEKWKQPVEMFQHEISACGSKRTP
jgi:hypothetical protein